MRKIYILTVSILLQSIVANAQWGENDTRTESRDNAGLRGDAGAKSGFYQTPNPVNFPTGAQGWWHLLDIRHSGPSNNYAMQFAGSFNGQGLFFRKTDNNPSQPWSKVLTVMADGSLEANKIFAKTTIGQSFFTGYQSGPTYSYPSGIFSAKTENANGTVNYYYDGLMNGVRKFYVRADGQSYFAGKVGIGIDAPKAALEVVGAMIIGISNIDARFDAGNLSYLPNSGKMVIGYNRSAGGGETSFISNQAGGGIGGFAFYNHDNSGVEKNLMWIQGNGSVGIGTTSPGDFKLAVNGKIRTKEVNVSMDNWPDYVFEEDYALNPLSEVESYIKMNKHLPDMPSATEVLKSGVNLGEINSKLLRKIEELTLHMISLSKENEKLKESNARISALEKKLDILMKTH